MSAEPHVLVEKERETAVRAVPCPTCAAPAGTACPIGRTRDGRPIALTHSHTARYLAAVDQGLVPKLGGRRG